MSFKEKLDYYGFMVVFGAGLAYIIAMLLTGTTMGTFRITISI